ncbi:MAG: Mrp/NBP35 family ATP-binding protein [Clostridia bacterium]|nr:Mrp/NBP35 family ATP-binding protein [Clostridia bacterium]
MSENCTHDCSSCGENCSSRKEEQSFLAPCNSMSNVKKVIGIVSGKGGVGKSLVTSLMAAGVQREGYRTAILDADITGPSIPKLFGINAKAEGTEYGILPKVSRGGTKIMSINLLLENDTDPVVWRGPVIGGTVKQFWTDVLWEDVDCMFVDMPPGTGDVPLTVFQSLPVDGIIVVTSPQELVSMIVEKAVNMAKMMNIPILGLVENMSYVECPNCSEKISIFGESKIDEVSKNAGLKALGKIPMKAEIASRCDAGQVEAIDGTPYLKNAIDAVKEIINS